jgi:hypothetical protein
LTREVLPRGVDIRWCFIPRRGAPIIEAGPYERIKRRDGRGYAYIAERRLIDFVWTGTSFRTRRPDSSEYTFSSL